MNFLQLKITAGSCKIIAKLPCKAPPKLPSFLSDMKIKPEPPKSFKFVPNPKELLDMKNKLKKVVDKII